MSRDSRNGFSLIELLVVIGIIAVLVSMLFPAVQKVREAAARTTCLSNMHQLGVALHGYHDAFGSLPPNLGVSLVDDTQWSWLARLLPFVEEQSLFNRAPIPAGRPADYSAVTSATVAVFICPSDPDSKKLLVEVGGAITTFRGPSNYKGNAGTVNFHDFRDSTDYFITQPNQANGAFPANRALAFASFTDGLTNSILFSEVGLAAKVGEDPTLIHFSWAVSGDAIMGCAYPPTNNVRASTPRSASSYHSGTTNHGFGDGSARAISGKISVAAYRAMSTRNGNEPPGGE